MEAWSIYVINDGTDTIPIFKSFSNLLKTYREPILNSFIYITPSKENNYRQELQRFSNGPMESFNNIPSRLCSDSKGLSNFEFSRNKILWGTRNDAAILAAPKSLKEIHCNASDKRGSYSK